MIARKRVHRQAGLGSTDPAAIARWQQTANLLAQRNGDSLPYPVIGLPPRVAMEGLWDDFTSFFGSGTSEQVANQNAIESWMGAGSSGALTLPYPGQGIPASATTQEQIIYASANPNTGVVNVEQAQYFIKGGTPPPSVLAADPLAAVIPSLDALTAIAGAQTPQNTGVCTFGDWIAGNCPSPGGPAGTNWAVYLALGGIAFALLYIALS